MTAKVLGSDDEPQQSGAVVAVHYGDYRRQEIWVSSGNVGNWYCLGGEGGRPKVWVDPRSEIEKLMHRGPEPRPGPGEVPLHPDWYDLLKRGPVTLLVPGDDAVYADGWRNGRRRLLEQIESLEEDEDVPPGHGWRANQEA